jgi:hypothetical protein
MGSGARGREFTRRRLKNFRRWMRCRVLIKKFKARGARHPLSPYLLVFTPSARRHFILHLSIFPLPLSLSLVHGGGGGGSRLHAVGVYRSVAAATTTSPRHETGVAASCSYRWRRERGVAWRCRARTDGSVSEVA